jgi:hypothetical protein
VSSWDPAAGHLELPAIPFIPGEVRVRFFLYQKRQRTTATQIPGEKLKKLKNPSVATSKRFHRERLATAKHRAPASTLFSLARFGLACLLQQRAGLQVTSPIHERNSNHAANCQLPYRIDFAWRNPSGSWRP